MSFSRLAATLTVVGALMVPGLATAVPVDMSDWTGSRDTFGFGLVSGGDSGAGGWTGFFLDYTITQDTTTGIYTYTYSFPDDDDPSQGVKPPMSSWILEVSPSILTAGNVGDPIGPISLNGTSISPTGPQTFGAGSLPGLPGSIYGIQLSGNTETAFEYSFMSDRSPIWGSFYATGQDGPPGALFNIWAYNSDFGTDPTGTTTDFTGWIPIPDTTNGTPAPEPGTLLLLGGGLLALGLRRRRRRH